MNKMNNHEIRGLIDSLKQSLKISGTETHRATITGMVTGLQACLNLKKSEIIDRIKDLDFAYVVSMGEISSIIIKNQVIAMCNVIYADCEKPLCVSQSTWDALKNHACEARDIKNLEDKFNKAKASPKNVREALANNVGDLYD